MRVVKVDISEVGEFCRVGFDCGVGGGECGVSRHGRIGRVGGRRGGVHHRAMMAGDTNRYGGDSDGGYHRVRRRAPFCVDWRRGVGGVRRDGWIGGVGSYRDSNVGLRFWDGGAHGHAGSEKELEYKGVLLDLPR